MDPDADARSDIAVLISSFYGLFDNRAGLSPLLQTPTRLFCSDVVIRLRLDGVWSTMDLNRFLSPRIELLRDGRLRQFHEWELHEQTLIAGDQAVRTSRYQKRGVLDDRPYEGTGSKTFQLLRLAEGWRIGALQWIDDA